MIQNLIDSIDNQKDTIVSKSLLKSSGGNVTLFAFSKGQELSEHSTLHHAMVQCLALQRHLIFNLVERNGYIGYYMRFLSPENLCPWILT